MNRNKGRKGSGREESLSSTVCLKAAWVKVGDGSACQNGLVLPLWSSLLKEVVKTDIQASEHELTEQEHLQLWQTCV